MFSKKGMLIIVALAVVSATIVAVLMFSKQPVVQKHLGVSIVHADPLDPTSGCAECHTEPIDADCTDCHSAPPTMIDSVSFPHHDPAPGGPPDSCQLSACHDGTQNDVRFVRELDANHSFCGSCHDMEHSEP